jgi:SAM-dependent methyltransferase
MNLLSILKEHKTKDLDTPSTTLQHREIILRKKFLKKLYIDWYLSMLKETEGLPDGKIVEIGSGGGFLKDLNPKIITSDILPFPHCDLTFPGEQMPFADNELSAILMIDVLHHIPDSRSFFREAQRVLKPGGKIIMIEPANTTFSRFIFQKFHHENFAPETKSWSFPTSGPLSGANGALPWIIFTRDYDNFRTEFPAFTKEKIQHHTPFAYLISGGLTFKSPLPGWLFGTFRWFESLFTPFNRHLAMFQTIVLVKTKQ